MLLSPLRIGLCLSLVAFVANGSPNFAHGAEATTTGEIQFNRDVRPILAENCFRCHGPDSAARKADLRLDRRDAAIEAKAIKPGEPDSSELVARIFSTNADEVMPPPQIHKDLTPAQKEILKRWVAAGAEYQPHWSFIAPQRPALPAVNRAGWVRNPIDHFVLAKLEQAGLEPAPEADRRTLARRVSLDLTGLPPAPADVETFLADTATDAYERFIDRLLASPTWGEHRGRYWLDAARYADTHGIHIDNYREMWLYRDWVIDAFNRNLPFDQFTIEQLAGDLLPGASRDQVIASGFNRCNITTSEGGAIDEEYLVLYDRDRTETTSQVWMGLTAGCAVCHDHKFDPLSQREFYELAAFFNNTTQRAMDGNVKDTPPVVFVPSMADEPRWTAIAAETPVIKDELAARKKASHGDYNQWAATADSAQVAALAPSDGLQLQALLSEGQGDSVTMMVNGQSREVAAAAALKWDPGYVANQSFRSQPGLALEVAEAGDFERDQAFTAAAWVKLTKNGQFGSIMARMDDRHDYRGWDVWLENGKVGCHIVHAWEAKNALKVVSTTAIKQDQWSHLLVTYDGSSKAAGLKVYINGKAEKTTIGVNGLTDTIRTEIPFTIAQRHTGSRIDDALIQDLRIYNRALSEGEVQQLAVATRISWLVSKAKDGRNPSENHELFEWWLKTVDKPTLELNGRLATLEREEAAVKSRGAITHVMNERPQEPKAFVLFRGEYDKRRDEVNAKTPGWLPPLDDEAPRNRLGLAQWFLQPEHPLTTRVTTNRFWQEVFGVGLVRSAGDFGVSGEQPSHPELLDWLAVEFRESGWDVKKFFKLLVTSATYRQSALTTPLKLERDPANRLLSRGPRFRMDAEMVRDYALASSGLLVGKIGGPSVKPYQPEGVWEAVAMPNSTTRDYKQDHGESLYRRSMYTLWKRSAPPASMDIFNAPSRESCTVRRERTNTPLQALVTLNDTQFVEAARNLAERAVQATSPEERIDFVARRLLCRPLCDKERAVLEQGQQNLLAYYQQHPSDAAALIAVGESKANAEIDPPTLAAWTVLASELMNLDEVLNK
jgi:cytochrome c553